ncbi:MAG: DUF3795 domain-containing protein [Methanoregula sp.]|nr:MAG: DUF3795 domain-containing protein [Methanoregula sp.]
MTPPYLDTIGMCGVYCSLASCFRTGRCRGCWSDNPRQPRTSKWKCRIRTCVLERRLNHCGKCKEFPCSIRRNLDKRYLDAYCIDLQENCRLLAEIGPEEWVQQSRLKHMCPSCGECIDPYKRTCYGCGKVIK